MAELTAEQHDAIEHVALTLQKPERDSFRSMVMLQLSGEVGAGNLHRAIREALVTGRYHQGTAPSAARYGSKHAR
jgi:hypothetical protein